MLDNNFGDLAYRFRWQIALLLVGLIISAGGVFLTLNHKNPEIEIITEARGRDEIVVEVSGAVANPSVYKLAGGSRIEDAINSAGGLTTEADLEWVGKYLNRAALVIDGQKIYIPFQGDQSNTMSANNNDGDISGSEVLMAETSEYVNINTASASDLDGLSGIGPVYAQKIIENRPYSTVEELSTKDIIPDKTYEEIKNLLTVY